MHRCAHDDSTDPATAHVRARARAEQGWQELGATLAAPSTANQEVVPCAALVWHPSDKPIGPPDAKTLGHAGRSRRPADFAVRDSGLRPHPRAQPRADTRDTSHGETYQYVKQVWIVGMLALLAWHRCSRFALCMAGLFTYFLIDDFAALHERFGKALGSMIPQETLLGLETQHLGELVVFGIYAFAASACIYACFPRKTGTHRKFAWRLLAILVLLAFLRRRHRRNPRLPVAAHHQRRLQRVGRWRRDARHELGGGVRVPGVDQHGTRRLVATDPAYEQSQPLFPDTLHAHLGQEAGLGGNSADAVRRSTDARCRRRAACGSPCSTARSGRRDPAGSCSSGGSFPGPTPSS